MDMIKIIKKVSPKIRTDFAGMGSQDGEYVPKAIGDKLIAAFKAAGYKTKGRLKHGDETASLQVLSKLNEKCGISIVDYDPDEEDAYGIWFYNED